VTKTSRLSSLFVFCLVIITEPTWSPMTTTHGKL